MSSSPADKKAELIERVATRLTERLPAGGAVAAQFARVYYARVAPEDLIGDDPEDLYGTVLAHWNLLRRTRVGETGLRVYNPDYDEHGWRSTHTAIELVVPDMPFLVDSLSMELNRQGFTVHRLIHPVLAVAYDGSEPVAVAETGAGDGVQLAVMQFAIDRETDAARIESLRADLARVLGDVRAAVEDWPRMLARLNEIADELDPAKLPVPAAEVEEARAFLDWAADNHFTLLGYSGYRLDEVDGELVLHPEPGFVARRLLDHLAAPLQRQGAAVRAGPVGAAAAPDAPRGAWKISARCSVVAVLLRCVVRWGTDHNHSAVRRAAA